MPAPICLFVYKRLDTLLRVVEALKQCELATESELFVFSDAPRTNTDQATVMKVRCFVKSISGFKAVHLKFAELNKGLAKSIITGVSEILASYNSVIVLEDDLVAAPSFLVYMNNLLDYYRDYPKVFSISGYTIPIKAPSNYQYDIYFFQRGCSWGWGTWKDRWINVDWEVSDYLKFRQNKQDVSAFAEGGSDLPTMLRKQMDGKLDSWAIRWCYSQFRFGQQTVYPLVSKIQNIGFDENATNTNGYNRYKTDLDMSNGVNYCLPMSFLSEENINLQLKKFYSLPARGVAKAKSYAMKLFKR